MAAWPIRKRHGTDKLWHHYLVYQVRIERDPAIGRFVDMRQVVDVFCAQTEASHDATARLVLSSTGPKMGKDSATYITTLENCWVVTLCNLAGPLSTVGFMAPARS